MANPSSTSSKRLVGLGLRGMRNSVQAPPTQVTAQIKSALAQSNPRTSPTVNFATAGTMTTTTSTTPGGLTRTTTTSPSGTSMRTSPSMMTITSFTHPNAAQHPNIVGGNTTMTRTPTSPIGIKALSGGGGVRGPATTSPTLLSRSATTTTRTSPFGTPASTPFVTPNTSPQMLTTAGHVASVATNSVNVTGAVEGGDLLVESGTTVPVGTSAKIELADASTRSMKSPYGEFRHTVDGYFGPMKRLEEIVNGLNGISEEMGEGGREGEGSSPHTEEPLAPELPIFFDVPFPLHPGKTFRIHSSPTTVNELITNGNPNISSRLESTIPERPYLPPGRVVPNASTSPAGKSDRNTAANNFNSSPKTLNTPAHTQSDNFLQRFINSTVDPPSSPAKSTNSRKLRFSPSPSPSPASYYSPMHPISSPRSSPSSNYSRISGGNSIDHKSFSTSSPLAAKSKSNFEGQLVSSPPSSPSSSLSRWLREGYEENYSTVCSPSSSPLLSGDGRRMRSRPASVVSSTSQEGSGIGLSSYSSVGSLSSRKRSGFNSPVAKIETVLGPRERGIGCIPEKRDYHSLYSRLRSGSMSPGSLTPLEENESMDFNFGDGVGVADADSSQFNNPTTPSPMSPSPSLSPSLPASSPIPGMPVVISSDTVVVANAAVGILSGAGTGTPAPSVAAATAPAPRLGLRRKSTGVGSPLVNVVATYDSIKNEQAEVDGRKKQIEGEDDGSDYGDTPMSPILMRTKDSLLLKDAQKQKRKNTMNADITAASTMEKSDFGVPESKSAPLVDSGIRWNAASGELRILVNKERKVRGLRSPASDSGEMRSLSPPFRSPESVYTVDHLFERPRSPRSPTEVPIPDTPTIGPCTMTMSGSRPVDEAISPLQLSIPILPPGACSKES